MLESFRRQMAIDLEGWRGVFDDAGRRLAEADASPAIDAWRAEVAAYAAHLLTTAAAMDGDVSPDEMLAMLFGGMDGFTTTRGYFDAIEGLQDDLLRRSETLDTIPPFLRRAADHDRAHGTALAASLVEALFGMAATVVTADLAADASERLFLLRYERQLAGFLAERGLDGGAPAGLGAG